MTSEKIIQGNSKDIDSRAQWLPLPPPSVKDLLPNSIPVCQITSVRKHSTDEIAQEHSVVQGYRHASAGEWMPHIPCITNKDDTVFGFLWGRGKEGVGHAT